MPRHNRADSGHAALILTSTLRPHAGANVKVTNPLTRVAQYRESLRWWKLNSPWPVVLADNSGSSLLDDLSAESDARCVIMAVEPPPENLVRTRGIGVAEALILRGAMEQMDPSYTSIVKVTGRLTVKNISSCFSSMDGTFVTCKITPDLRFSDSRIFAGDRSSFGYLVDRVIDQSDDASGRFFEHELAAGALRLVSDGVPFRAFRRLPSVNGVSGTSGTPYGNALHETGRAIHDVARRFAGWQRLSL